VHLPVLNRILFAFENVIQHFLFMVIFSPVNVKLVLKDAQLATVQLWMNVLLVNQDGS
jgi:hypothetical protein